MPDLSKTALIVEDDLQMLELLGRHLKSLDYQVFKATNVEDALELLKESAVDLLITDLRMPGLSGMDLLEYVVKAYPEIAVLVVTGFPSVSGAVDALKMGAVDYLTKPFTEKEIREAVLQTQKKIHSKVPSAREKARFNYYGLIGASDALKSITEIVERIKNTRVTTLITGESGTGKEVLARAIHYSSSYSKEPFIAVNCGAIPENLLESELFGVAKGAYTGATHDREGFFEAANGGTIFLDEISSASMAVQTRLLRVIQDKSFHRVGSTKTQKINVRIVAASNVDLMKLCEKERFRTDLYYRLNVIRLDIPSLKQRKEDIEVLADHFMKKFYQEFDLQPVELTNSFLNQLLAYHWPGNVRELENIIQRWVLMADLKHGEMQLGFDVSSTENGIGIDSQWKSLEEKQLEYIQKVLSFTEGNKSKAAAILGIDRKTLRKKLEKP